MPASVRLSVRYDDASDARLLREAAAENSVEATEPRGLEPITTMILAGAIFAVAGAVAGWLSKRKRAGKSSWGQVIDLRPGRDDPVYRDEDLEFGQIVVISPTGDGKNYEVRIEVYDPDNDFIEIAKLITKILSEGAVKPLEIIAKAATEAVGSKGEVEVAEHSDA